MRALRRSISATPCVPSQYPQLRAFFGLGKRRDASQGLVSAVSGSTPPSLKSPLPESIRSECTICRGESGDGEMSLKVPAEGCTHPAQVCVGCLRQVILAAITSGDFITGIICPSSGCSQRLGYRDVQKCAAQKVFDRYDNLLMRDSLRANENYVFCANSGCTTGQEHTGGEDNNIVICHLCGTKQCFRHRTLWHEDLTCEQWDEQQLAIAKQQEQKTEHWIETGTKPCPGPGCGRRIQKIDGCDHMTCKRPGGCGHQFCWECLAPWFQIISSDNSKHYDNCKYYSGRPGKNPAPPEVVAARTVHEPPVPSTLSLPASPVARDGALFAPQPLRELLLPHAIQQRKSVAQPVRSGEGSIEIPIQALHPSATENAPPAGPSKEPSGSSRQSVQAEYGQPNQGPSLSEGSMPTPCGPAAGPSNQTPPTTMPSPFGDSYDLYNTSALTGDFGEDQPRRKNVEAQKLYRKRKKEYEAGLVSTVQSLQERIDLLEVELGHDRPKPNMAPWPPNPAWLGPGYQLPPLYDRNLYPVNQTGLFAQHDSHNLGPLDARFMQSGSAVESSVPSLM